MYGLWIGLLPYPWVETFFWSQFSWEIISHIPYLSQFLLWCYCYCSQIVTSWFLTLSNILSFTTSITTDSMERSSNLSSLMLPCSPFSFLMLYQFYCLCVISVQFYIPYFLMTWLVDVTCQFSHVICLTDIFWSGLPLLPSSSFLCLSWFIVTTFVGAIKAMD